MPQVVRSFLSISLWLVLIGLVSANPVFPAEQPKTQRSEAGATKATPPADTAAAGPLQVNDTLPAPPGFVQASKCVAHEGIHYIREGTSSLPSVLAYDESGKLVSIGYIIPQRQSKGRVSWKGLPGVAGRPVDHINIEYSAPSSRAGGVPHYTLHLYFIPLEEQQRICPESVRSEPILRTTR
jgi:hypothetical protein